MPLRVEMRYPSFERTLMIRHRRRVRGSRCSRRLHRLSRGCVAPEADRRRRQEQRLQDQPQLQRQDCEDAQGRHLHGRRPRRREDPQLRARRPARQVVDVHYGAVRRDEDGHAQARPRQVQGLLLPTRVGDVPALHRQVADRSKQGRGGSLCRPVSRSNAMVMSQIVAPAVITAAGRECRERHR